MNHNPVTKWKKGQSGNPNGRPRIGHTMTETLRRLLEEKREDGQTYREAILLKMRDLAIGGNLEAAKYVIDRLEGKPAQALELSGDQRRPLRIEYVLPKEPT